MPAPRNRRHLLVPAPPSIEAYRPHPRKVVRPPIPGPGNRRRHAANLRAALGAAQREASASRDSLGISVHGAEPGLYIQFESPPGVPLKLESLEDRRKGIELVAVQTLIRAPDEPSVQLATVFVPDGALTHFFTRFQQYATERTAKGEPRYKDTIDRIAALRRATLRALWTDDPGVYPGEDEPIWWEVWLRRPDGRELERLLEFTELVGLGAGERRLAFADRIIVLVEGTARLLSGSLDVLNDVAEVRRAKESAALFVDAAPEEQAGPMEELRRRTTPPPGDAPAVCVLDTGVNRGHPLLEDVIGPADAMAVDPTWGAHDDGGGPGNMGHGTEMAGLAAYGDLTAALASRSPVHLRHRVESVKILPPRGGNPPELYGAVTAQAVARPEVNAPHRLRAFSLAVTATDERDRGQPTSWSAAVDALAAGRTFDPANHGLVYLDRAEDEARRLFVVSVGNVPSDHLDVVHLDRSDVEAVHDPAQAWNALTVGAFTDRAVITQPQWEGWLPISRPGDLSPWSTTSVTFQDIWPIKPDVVCEGGNVAHNGGAFNGEIPDLCLLSTYYRPAERLFVLSCATSSATAQVARMAAIIRAEYPALWPETVRGLIVHSAGWTRTMMAESDPEEGSSVATASAYLISGGRMREMHLHNLPWPKTVLEGLGQTSVHLRVTLSYFIEPDPGRRGWTRRHRYASHGLRFEVKSPTETLEEFRKRLNQRALEEDEERPITSSDAAGWFLGEQTRNKGSLHSDMWVGTAADLAERGVIGIYPVSGWWKDQPKRDRSEFGARYALVVSLETEAEGVDIWTPVAQEIGVLVEETPVEA